MFRKMLTSDLIDEFLIESLNESSDIKNLKDVLNYFINDKGVLHIDYSYEYADELFHDSVELSLLNYITFVFNKSVSASVSQIPWQ